MDSHCHCNFQVERERKKANHYETTHTQSVCGKNASGLVFIFHVLFCPEIKCTLSLATRWLFRSRVDKRWIRFRWFVILEKTRNQDTHQVTNIAPQVFWLFFFASLLSCCAPGDCLFSFVRSKRYLRYECRRLSKGEKIWRTSSLNIDFVSISPETFEMAFQPTDARTRTLPLTFFYFF